MRFSKAIWASVVRVGLFAHSMAALYGLIYTTQISLYWFIGTTLILLMVEIPVTYHFSKLGEWKWFVPSAFIYLCTVIPVIWLLEIASMNFRIEVQDRLGVSKCPVDLSAYLRNDQKNITLLVSDNLTSLEKTKNNEREIYSTVLQQTIMLVLILGRWLQPRGELSRDQLSQLLLVYIGMAADMLEFSSVTLRLEVTACIPSIYITVLTVWSWSLTQFTLGLTATSNKKRRLPTTTDSLEKIYSSSIDSMILKNRSVTAIRLRLFKHGICGTELWAVLTSVLVQDGPYLAVRLYIMFHFNIYDQSMLFFASKNALLLFLMSYRLFVVLHEAEKRNKSKLRTVQDRTQPVGNSRHDSPSGQQVSSQRSYRTRTNLELLDFSMLDDEAPNMNINLNENTSNYALRMHIDDKRGGNQTQAYGIDFNETNAENEVYIVRAEYNDNDVPTSPGPPPDPPPLPPSTVSSPSIKSSMSNRQPPPVATRHRRDHSIYAKIPLKK